MTHTRPRSSIGRRIAPVVAGCFALVGVGLAGAALWLNQGTPAEQGTALIGGPFNLVDQNGQPATAETFKGEPFLVFFGYTHCPDVCPTTLSDMSQMLNTLGRDKQVRALFITVDPERDTPAVLKDYLSSFDSRIIGLTGSLPAVEAAEKAYRVYARKVPTQNGDYSMDHTAVVYLMNGQGRFVQALNLQQPPEKAAAEVAALM